MKKNICLGVGVCLFIVLISLFIRLSFQEKVIETALYDKIINVGVPKEKIRKSVYAKSWLRFLKGQRYAAIYLKNASDEFYFEAEYNTTISKALFNLNLAEDVANDSWVGGYVQGTVYGTDNEGDEEKLPKDCIPKELYKYLK